MCDKIKHCEPINDKCLLLDLPLTAVVTLLETSKETGEECVRTVAFLRKGNSFGVSNRRAHAIFCSKSCKYVAQNRVNM